MNAVEIEQAITDLAAKPFDAAEFPFAFLEAFGNKETTLRKLRKGESNKSDFAGPWGGVLQANNIHVAVAPAGEVTSTLAALKASPATSRWKAKFILATDGATFEAENLTADGETVACSYAEFPDHFGFFLALAGITTVKQVRESSFDIRATSRLNRLYVELLKDNPDWGTAERRPDMNHFMARLIFCFFAEDTDIFNGTGLFTATVEQMSARDSSNTHEVIGGIFHAMNTPIADRPNAGLPRWADAFPYVNGGLFSGSTEAPRFSRIARSYLLHIGQLKWTQINPDIFGSMIQAVADDEERGALGMHYTSVPNILKVLNPLFLDDLRAKLEEAGDNSRTLLNLRRRMARIRVFDPACGSGNFLVIAYKEMRAIEAEINRRRHEPELRSEIPLTNFRGIEIRDFPAEIARLALIIAEYQCDVLYRGQKEALAEFLPLDAQNWITCGNALRLDWLSLWPQERAGVKLNADDLFSTPLDQAQIDFENEVGETYICGNPPYLGSRNQTDEHRSDLAPLMNGKITNWKSLDYVAGWIVKAAAYLRATAGASALVTTNSICQGLSVPTLWPHVLCDGMEIFFAHRSFKWTNLAAHNAGVTVAIIGLAMNDRRSTKYIVDGDERRAVPHINPYLIPAPTVFVEPRREPPGQYPMLFGNMPRDGSHLSMDWADRRSLLNRAPEAAPFVFRYLGSEELINGQQRYCVWVSDSQEAEARSIPELQVRFDGVAAARQKSPAAATRAWASRSHRFVQVPGLGRRSTLALAGVSSETREYLPVTLLGVGNVVSNLAFVLYDAPLWNMALIASRIHLVWIATVCGKLETRYRYSNTLGWNTFPVPPLTEKNKADLTRCAEHILLAREAHFPATIADLYDPDAMPADLRAAHDANDETLERIYIGRRFRNDTERLEKLFEMYTKMTANDGAGKRKAKVSA